MSNVNTAKLFFGIVLNKLQYAFPAAVHLSSQDLWPEFAKAAPDGALSIKNSERSYQTTSVRDIGDDKHLQQHYTVLMLRWMAAEGFLINDPASNFPYDYVLSAKALAALNIQIDKEKKTVGEMLANAAKRTGDAAQSELIQRLVGRMFDHLQGLAT